MEKLDHLLLQSVLQGFQKQSFVPMPGGQSEPVAGASPMTAGMSAPMGGAPAGGMPPGGDPAMMQGEPMPPGGDPAMMGLDPATGMPLGMPPPVEGEAGAAPAAAPATDPSGKLDEILKELKALHKEIADMKREKLHQSTDKLHGELSRLVDLLSRAADGAAPQTPELAQE